MKNSAKKFNIFRSRIFWKIFAWILFVLGLILGFSTYIIFSNFEAGLGQTIKIGALADDYALLQTQSLIILLILYTIFTFIGFFSARIIALKIIQTSEYIKKINQMDLDKKLEIFSDDEFREIALNLNNLTLKLKEKQEKEKFINKIKSDFITIAAHQLRTPLSVIKWTLHALKSGDLGKLNKEQASYIDKGIITSEHMIVLINDLLNVSRIEQGEFDYNFESKDLKETILKIEKIYRSKCLKAGLELALNLYNGQLKVRHDSQKIEMAMDNLVNNAIKYTPRGGKISISAKIKKDLVEVSIQDTGMGIPEYEQEKIFQRFFRGDRIMKTNTEGSGLGLFITKSIVEKHGGQIWFESKQNRGTIFYFTLAIEGRKNSKKGFEELIKQV